MENSGTSATERDDSVTGFPKVVSRTALTQNKTESKEGKKDQSAEPHKTETGKHRHRSGKAQKCKDRDEEREKIEEEKKTGATECHVCYLMTLFYIPSHHIML